MLTSQHGSDIWVKFLWRQTLLMEKLTHTVTNTVWQTFNIQWGIKQKQQRVSKTDFISAFHFAWLTDVWLGSFVTKRHSTAFRDPDHIKLSYRTENTIYYTCVSHWTVTDKLGKSYRRGVKGQMWLQHLDDVDVGMKLNVHFENIQNRTQNNNFYGCVCLYVWSDPLLYTVFPGSVDSIFRFFKMLVLCLLHVRLNKDLDTFLCTSLMLRGKVFL